MKAKKWKKRDRKFNNNKFSYKVGQKTYLKAQKCWKLAFAFAWLKLFTQKRKREFFPQVL